MQQQLSIASAARYLGQPADPLKTSVDQLKLQVEDISMTVSSMQSVLHSVKSTTSAFEREFPDVLRQLDILAGQLEREKGDVAVLKEQLAFFAGGGGRAMRNDGAADANASRGLYAFLLGAVMRYLYTPFLFFVHGMYILLAPVLTTFRCLSIFRGSTALDELSDDDDDVVPQSGSTLAMSSVGGTRQLKHEAGYLLMALANRATVERPVGELRHRSNRLSRDPTAGDVSIGNLPPSCDIATPFPKVTPQRGTELYTLLQQTKIDSRTASSRK